MTPHAPFHFVFSTCRVHFHLYRTIYFRGTRKQRKKQQVKVVGARLVRFALSALADFEFGPHIFATIYTRIHLCTSKANVRMIKNDQFEHIFLLRRPRDAPFFVPVAQRWSARFNHSHKSASAFPSA
jgi:hypothetical protein